MSGVARVTLNHTPLAARGNSTSSPYPNEAPIGQSSPQPFCASVRGYGALRSVDRRHCRDLGAGIR